jgi:hypothetical protein
MTTTRDVHPRRHPFTPFRKDDSTMNQIEYQYQEIRERQARYRAEAQRERRARASRDAFRNRTFRHRIGESIIRVGQKVGGDAVSEALSDVTNPAWQG